jgi:integrase/recombinase XerD
MHQILLNSICLHCCKFIKYYGKETIAVTDEEIVKYLSQESATKSYSTINLYKETLKKYFSIIYNKKFSVSLSYSRKEKKLPVILSVEEVKKILTSFTNEKHYLALALAYGTGMRVSEIAMLKKQDIDRDRMIIHIKQAK